MSVRNACSNPVKCDLLLELREFRLRLTHCERDISFQLFGEAHSLDKYVYSN